MEPAYTNKPATYFSGARRLFVDDLPPAPQARLIEIGCGNGDTAAYALATGKCGWAAGVELCAEPAAEARTRLHEVVTADVETVALPFAEDDFDVLILSEVLEHLRDPGRVLTQLRRHLKPGALVLSGSPNVAHHSVVRMIVAGYWTLTPTGIMDATHLRWFTPLSYRRLFEDAGYVVDRVIPSQRLRPKARWFNRLTMGRFHHLLFAQIYLTAHRPR